MGLTPGQCPLCKVPAPLLFTTTDVNRAVSLETFDYHRCPSCDLIFIGRIPQDLFRYYPSGYHPFPRSQADLERIAGRIRYQIEMVCRFASGGRLLEIGPGFGAFAWLAKRAGFEVETIEQDSDCCGYLSERVGVAVTRTAWPVEVLAERPGRYAAIVLWHVLEHLTDPWDVLHHAAGALKADGILVVATPNPLAWQFEVLGARWPHVDAPRHLYLVPAAVLRRQLEDRGLHCLLLTATDPGGLGWNRFGWGQAAVNLLPFRTRGSVLTRGIAWAIGHCASWVAARFERRDLRGSAYTAVFRRPT